MNQFIVLLFAVPVLCIVVTALCQFVDEIFTKKFVADRRAGSDDQDSNPGRPGTPRNRRYNDPVVQALSSEIRPETRTETRKERQPESSATLSLSIFEPSIVRR